MPSIRDGFIYDQTLRVLITRYYKLHGFNLVRTQSAVVNCLALDLHPKFIAFIDVTKTQKNIHRYYTPWIRYKNTLWRYY
jgi:hypothetical protein